MDKELIADMDKIYEVRDIIRSLESQIEMKTQVYISQYILLDGWLTWFERFYTSSSFMKTFIKFD